MFSTIVVNAQFNNATITKLNGNVVEMRITEALPFVITGVLKGKITAITADSLKGFHFEGNDYLSTKTTGMEHYEFSIKLKSMDEFDLYGWKENVNLNAREDSFLEPVIVYKYIKRKVDADINRVFEYSRQGVEEIAIVNCPSIWQEMLKKYASFEKLVDLLEVYERDCGIEMRSR